MPVDFTAIDFETANSSNASACAVGLVRVRDSQIVAQTGWLIRPPAGHEAFFELNTRIHGLTAEDVADAPRWDEQIDRLAAFAGADILVAHNAGFDMAVMRSACEVTEVPCPPYRYACSLQAARKAYRLDSYRLPFVAAEAGFTDFAHHNAVADALACAHVMIDIARRTQADSIDALATALGTKIKTIGAPTVPPVAARERAASVA